MSIAPSVPTTPPADVTGQYFAQTVQDAFDIVAAAFNDMEITVAGKLDAVDASVLVVSDVPVAWTPYVFSPTPGNLGLVTYTKREGWWWRVGDTIHVVFNVEFTTPTLAGGTEVAIAGAPWMPRDEITAQMGGKVSLEKITAPASAIDIIAKVVAGDPSIHFVWSRSALVSIGLLTSDLASGTAAVAINGSMNFLAETDQLIEHVDNGGFVDNTGWTLGANWSVAAGVATRAASAGASSISRTPQIPLVVGASYRVAYEVTAWTAGSVRARLSGGTPVNGTSRSAIGTYVETLVADTGNDTIELEGTAAAFAGSVDNFSIVRIA